MSYAIKFKKENLIRFFIDEKTGYFKYPSKVKSEFGKVYTLDPLGGSCAFYFDEKGEEIEAYFMVYDFNNGSFGFAPVNFGRWGDPIYELRSKTKYDDEGRKIMRNLLLIPFE
jgi:hypothetical protein